jgi:hypothetical protein
LPSSAPVQAIAWGYGSIYPGLKNLVNLPNSPPACILTGRSQAL